MSSHRRSRPLLQIKGAPVCVYSNTKQIHNNHICESFPPQVGDEALQQALGETREAVAALQGQLAALQSEAAAREAAHQIALDQMQDQLEHFQEVRSRQLGATCAALCEAGLGAGGDLFLVAETCDITGAFRVQLAHGEQMAAYAEVQCWASIAQASQQKLIEVSTSRTSRMALVRLQAM